MNPLFLVLALSIPEVHAGDPFGLDSLLDDTAAPVEVEETRSASWPTSSRIDQIDRNLTVQWPDQPTESLPLQALLQIEHARAYEDAPAELFAVFSDGRRILLSRGPSVTNKVGLLQAWLAHVIVELPVGEGHSQPPTPTTPSPSLTISAGSAILSLGKLNPAASTRQSGNTSQQNLSSNTSGGKDCTDCVDRRDVDRMVKMHMDTIQGCYQLALQRDTKLAGGVTVDFVIQKDGRVNSASIKRSDLNNSSVEQCIRDQFLKMKFPAPPGGAMVSVSYPLVFSSR
ncbi:MAG: AgmX/PglI C-terminal domain-containing protein [Myxococcota bacterium]